jgi:cytochrome c5
MSVLRTFLLLAAVVALAACDKPSPAPDELPAPTVSAPAGSTAAPGSPTAAAQEIFNTRCTPCHGASGAGDGPASASLTPKPRNFHDAAWHASVDDAYIEKIIKFGGAAVGKSPAMPGNPDLNDPAVLAELRTHIRSFKN